MKDGKLFQIEFGISHLKMQTFLETLEISLCFKEHQLTAFIKSSGEAFLKAYEGFGTGDINQ